MKSNIIKLFCGTGLLFGFCACQNSDIDFPDYEGGTTVYFAYQYPVRTIVLGDDEYDTTLDQAHKCQIKATFGGSYNGSDGSVQVAVADTLCNNLFFADGVTPVKAMPSNYYQLSTTNLNFNGSMYGTTEVQLTDAFFADPDAVKNTYVIPLLITSQNGFGKILAGSWLEGQSGARCDESVWEVQPMDYILYCVKYQNKYSGYWLTNGNTSTDNIEKAQAVQLRTKSLSECIYTVSYVKKYVVKTYDDNSNEVPKEEERIYTADLLLTFDATDKCTISSLTPSVTATGTGSWGDNSEKKAWGNKDRDGLELDYVVDFHVTDDYDNVIENGTTHEKLVWQRSGVTLEEFSPVYVK